MKIAMVASEAAPYAKSGGLGDVMLGLPSRAGPNPDNQVACSSPSTSGQRESRL